MPQWETDIVDLVILAALALVLLVAVVIVIRRPGGDGEQLAKANIKLTAAVEAKDAELREALRNANRFEALADERKSENERLNGDLSKLRAKLDGASEERRQLTGSISQLETKLEAERQFDKERLETLTRFRGEMEAKFGEMASEALKIQGERFSKSSIERLEAALTPLKEHVGHFENELKNVHQETIKDRERLKTEIAQLSRRSEEISQEAVALARALRGDRRAQGAWGELILERILQISGLREGEEYETQAHRVSDGGERLRPDVVVNIPGGKTLVIDSKVSLVAYTDAVNADDGKEVTKARERLVKSLRDHINTLASKDYQHAEDVTVDYVIMFVPIEGALSEALREDGSIMEAALEHDVTIATPTTLMMALRTIANVWAVERRNQNAEEIARRAGRLYDKVVGFVDNMEHVGKRLGQAQDAYETAFGQLSRGRGNMLAQIETLKTLGAKTTRSIGVDIDDSHEETELLEVEVPGNETT